jgi:hypothetical protein
VLRRILLPALLVSSVTAAAEEPAALAECDAHWARRAEGSSGGTAKREEIDLALASCKKAEAAEPSSLEPRWRTMRALYFKGEYTTNDPEEKKRVFDEGKREGEEALALIRKQASPKLKKPADKATPVELVPALKGDVAALRCFLWAAVDWGKWALAFGKSQAVKQGAAAKIRDYAAAAIQLDPAFDDGGGYRVLGRLHHQTPAVPFFTGWASRKDALENLRLAMKVAPRHFINRLYLAEAFWDYEKERSAEAVQMLEALVADTPSPEYAVEDRKTQEEAKALLSTWKKR